MQQQYNQIKQAHPEEIVLFRLGDFYETFDRDAEVASQVLGITLTGRGKGENRVPMAGIPFHALDNYLPRLIEAKLKVVIVDQLQQPETGKLVERGVTKIITAGNLVDETVLTDSANNFIVSLFGDSKSGYGIGFADVTTGLLKFFQTSDLSLALGEIHRLSPAEVISTAEIFALTDLGKKYAVTIKNESDFEYDSAYKFLTTTFKVQSLKGFGLEQYHLAIQATGTLLRYIQSCQLVELTHFSRIGAHNLNQFMKLGRDAIQNLELVIPSNPHTKSLTLYDVLNNAQTSMGKRKLRDWLLHPLIDTSALTQRWEAVGSFLVNPIANDQLRERLSQIGDIERMVGRIGLGSASPRDLLGLKQSLDSVRALENLLAEFPSAQKLTELQAKLELSPAVLGIGELINRAIDIDAPAQASQGGILAQGFNQEVDELRDLRSGGKSVLAEIQQREIAATGISSLKVSYNRVFGYYIEITNTHSHKVPPTYIRKQTLANAERYITQELKEWEEKILSAEEKLIALELQLFRDIISEISAHNNSLLDIADSVAELDVLANFSQLARDNRYVKPTLSSRTELTIIGGRHPVVEKTQAEFTPNNTELTQPKTFTIITGPNMSGKSTYIRQVALLCLMAQIGSFVPADQMTFSIVDQIFTRIGASDNLSQGESTFMVEMTETANILHNATANSLIILDEVGRGTSTFDGVALAWAIAEFIIEQIQARTLFATHYHELVGLSKKYEQVTNSFVEVKESGGEILFLHKISPGVSDRSYGVHVAKLAGVPAAVVTKANQILEQFNSDNSNQVKQTVTKSKKGIPTPKHVSPQQIELL